MGRGPSFRRHGGRESGEVDEQVMTRLYREHHGVLLAFVRRYVPDRDHAEDLTQETMLRAWRNLDSLDSGADSVRSYLFTVARNVVTDAWRAERRRPRLVSDDVAVAGIPGADELSRVVEGWLVEEALGRLSAEHRAVVRELYYYGHSVREAASRLTLPEGTVKSRAYYAVRALRATFEEMGFLR